MILPSRFPGNNVSCNGSRRRNLSETLFVRRNNLPCIKHLPEILAFSHGGCASHKLKSFCDYKTHAIYIYPSSSLPVYYF